MDTPMIKDLWDRFKEAVSLWDIVASFLMAFLMTVAAYPMLAPMTEREILGLIFLGMVVELAFAKLIKRRSKKDTQKEEES